MAKFDAMRGDLASADYARKLYWVEFLDVRARITSGVLHLTGKYPIATASVKLVGAYTGDKLYTRLAGAGGIMRESAIEDTTSERCSVA